MIGTSCHWTITPDAERFVSERKFKGYLEVIVELTAQVFRDARCIDVDLHEDPDIAGVHWVLVRVEVAWSDAERARQARDEWYARTAEALPPAVLEAIGLEIDRRPE